METITSIKSPEYSDYKCEICGVTYIPLKGKEPNIFHRFMQELCFGVKWRKRKR